MPRKPGTQTTSRGFGVRTEAAEKQTIEIEKTPWREEVRTFLLDPRTRLVGGVVLMAVALFLLVAYVSFFFTGTADQSLLDMSRADRRAHRGEIQNILGLPGAALADFLIDGSFGVVSVLGIILLIVIGLYLVKVRFESLLRAFVCTVFWLLWGAVAIGFLQLQAGVGTFRWGGAFGAWFSQWLNSYIQPVGMVIVLGAVLLIFLILADKQFISRCKRLWWRIRLLLRRKPKPAAEAEQAEDETIVLPDQPGDEEQIEVAEPEDEEGESVSVGDDEVPLIIDNLQVEAVEEPAEEPAETPEEEPEETDGEEEGEPDFGITDTQPVELADENSPEAILAKLGPYDPRKDLEYFKFPSLDLLKVYDNETAPVIDQDEQRANGTRIVTTLRNYGIEIESIKATVGPTVTLYEIVPKAGVRVSKIQSLENDIMLSLSATGIRIIAPMPGKGTVGIEVPNEKPQIVSMHSVIASKRFQDEQKMRLPVAIGRTITNEVFMFDLAKTPHLLVAGATGQGKSVAINAILTSLLYKKHPAELKFVLVDPKMVEFTPYKALMRHYLAAMPEVEDKDIIITDCDKVINTLNSLVIEMENRYKLLMDAGVRNLEDYNDKFVRRRLNPEKLVADSLHHQFLPYIVIVIDEYGDFIMQAGKQVETPIARITQKARAVGMHMILATQRPSVNIVTGVIKANIPTRIALRTQSVIDSRTVLDTKGAEQLIGRGDLLYSANGNVIRIQCAFVDTPEVDAIVEHIQGQQRYFEPYQLPEYVPEGAEEALAPGSVDMKKLDPMFADVARYVVTKQEGSTSRLQRAFEIGYNRAGKLSDQLEAAGIVGPNKGPKGRDVLITDLDQLERLLEDLNAK